jgi:beta-glucosidase
MLARSLTVAAVLGVFIALPITVSAAGETHRFGGSTPIYENRSYSPAERAADLVSRMTLAEKASQMISSQAPAIPRLGIQAYGWWNEALHGVSRLQLNPTGNATTLFNTTSYPISLALGSSWDPSVMYREATAIGDEAREVVPDNTQDLDFYSPTVNLARDPRWGRNDEAFSEDPLLTSAIASQFVDGMEGKDQHGNLLPQGGGYLKTITTIKHYALNNTEGDRLNDNTNRLKGNSVIDERTLREYYTQQFKQIIEQSHPGSIMSSYNRVNGIPAAANVHLIDTLARQTFGFGGYFTSDCDAVFEIVNGHHWQPPGWSRPVNNTERSALANAAGEDLNCNTGYHDSFSYANSLPTAAGQGIPTQTDTFNTNDMDASLVRLFTARMRLGEFDNVANEPWVKAARAALPPNTWVNSDANNAVTETPARLQLAQEVGEHSYVLLRNADTTLKDGSTGKVLPLRIPSSGPFKVAVIGYLANPSTTYLGGYSSEQGAPGTANIETPYAGIKKAIQAINPNAQVDFLSGFTGNPTTAAQLTSIDPTAVAAAANYDAAIVYAGTDDSTANEFFDRTDLALPGAQAQLINEVATKNPNTAAVIRSIGQVDLGSFENNVPAVLWSTYNGQREGDAIADVLLGNYDPSGHLPFTWYQSVSELPKLDDYSIRPSTTSPGRTYMYFRGPVSHPFGYGLSYTTFSSSNLRLDRGDYDANGTIRASVDVTNTGSRPGSDLVQLYVTTPDARASLQRPIKRLEGFEQVPLDPGQTKTVDLQAAVPKLAFFDERLNRYTVDDGRYGIQIASSAADSDVEQQRFVSVHGSLPVRPSVLSAKPVMRGDARRGIQSRVTFPEHAVVLPRLTLSMDDESLYGYITAGNSTPLPHRVVVRYTSDHPNVVAIGRHGTIVTVHNGVATVTATASIHGTTVSTRFVVRVLTQADRLFVGGRSLRGFHPDTFSYDVVLPDRVSAPRVRAFVADPAAQVTVTQATSVPGVASVNVTGPDGVTTTYQVSFAHPAQSDEFSGTDVGPQWSWVRRDTANEHVSSGSLTITPTQGDLAGTTNTAHNILAQPALGDWTIESKLTFTAPPHSPTQQAGIIAYQDDDNYLKLDWEFSGNAAHLVETTEDSLSGAPVTQTLATVPLTSAPNNTIWLRMVKHGPRYATYYSIDGTQFLPVYEVGQSLSNTKVGLFALNGAGTTSDLSVAFDYFHVTNPANRIGGRLRR